MRTLLLLMALCFCPLVWAAENTLPVPATDEQEPGETEQDPDQELLLEEEALILAEIDETEEEESADRFIPTEQISQDLGVSFPVDI